MTPKGWGYTIRAAVQENIWPFFEAAFPEFGHSMNSSQLAKSIEELGPEVTCIDGSSFEGS